MGNCVSCESGSNVTAKLILLDGRLQEFSCPVKVSNLLEQDINHPDSFICSSDQMELNEFLVEIGGEEVLLLGELYFEVPARWRNHRLQVEDMAALVVKANVALSAGSGGDGMIRCGCCLTPKRVNSAAIVFHEKERPLLAEDCSGGGWVDSPGRKVAGAGRCRGGKFAAKLSAIVEEL